MDPRTPAFARSQSSNVPGQQGMSIRTYLAGQALTGLLANPETMDVEIALAAEDALRYADALLGRLSGERANDGQLLFRVIRDVEEATEALQAGRAQAALALLTAILVRAKVAIRTDPRVDLVKEAGPLNADDSD
jgi:hypothetical protein